MTLHSETEASTNRTRAAENAAANPVVLHRQIWVIFVAVAAVMLSPTRADPDLWGHLRFGLDWWHTRALPYTDPYSFTQDKPWINHEWLSEAFMGAAYLLGGVRGLVVLKMMIAAIALAVLARRLRGSSPLLSALVMAVAMLAALPLTATVRPQLWSMLALVLLVVILDAPGRPSWRRVIGAGCVFAAWANLHGGWITGAAVAGVYAAVRVLRAPREMPAWLTLIVVSFAATLLNPYGVGLWRFLATTVRASRPDITEWQPLGFNQPAILWLAPVGALLLALVLSRRRETRPSPEVWAVLLLLAAGSVRVLRVAALMALPAATLLAPSIRAAWGDRGHLSAPGIGPARVLYVPGLILSLAALTFTLRSMACLPALGTWMPDRVAAARLRGLSGRLLTTFDWGEYAIWHFGPSLRVSLDGRRETVYSDRVVQWHRAFAAGDPAAQAVVASLAPDYVWLPADRVAARTWLTANGYDVQAQTERSFIAVRRGAEPLPGDAPALPACFP